MKFRKKPVVIEAIQWNGTNADEIIAFTERKAIWSFNNNPLTIPTLGGNMEVSVGDWIIRGAKGEYYPCKPDIFEATYEPEDARQTFPGHTDNITKIIQIINERLRPDNLDVRVAAGTANTYNIQVSGRATGPRRSFYLRARDGKISDAYVEGGSWSGMIARPEWLTSVAYALLLAGIRNFYMHVEEL